MPGGTNAKPPKLKPKLMLATLLLSAILLASCSASLTQPASNSPTVITRPTLTSLKTLPDGGISMDKRDTGELLIYIEAIENALGIVR